MPDCRIYCYEEPHYIIYPEVRASFEDAAKRWKATLVFLERPIKRANYWMQKQKHVLRSVNADRILWLDGDMLIRADCPNPFEVVPRHKIGFVSVSQDHRTPCSHIPQGGFQLYTPKEHNSILRNLDSFFRRISYNGIDQQHLADRIPNKVIQWLPAAYNFLVLQKGCPGWLSKWHEDLYNTAPMLPNWICHFRNSPGKTSGMRGKLYLMRRFNWEITPLIMTKG